MTDAEHFEAVLHELACVLRQLGDLSSDVVLIGGQALALESLRARKSPLLQVETETGLVVDRGFTFEPDLLFDIEDAFQAERLPEVLRARGYERVRTYRWSRLVRVGAETLPVELDLFAPPQETPHVLPTPMTTLPDARLALRQPRRIEVSVNGRPFSIAVPNPAAFLAMKVRAKQEQRPDECKDCFDLYAYVSLMGLTAVRSSLSEAGREGSRVRNALVVLFHDTDSMGVEDVVRCVSGLSPQEMALLRQAVVDLFADL